MINDQWLRLKRWLTCVNYYHETFPGNSGSMTQGLALEFGHYSLTTWPILLNVLYFL